MPETGKKIRLELTEAEVITLVRLTWNAIKDAKVPERIDFTMVRVFAKAAKAARDLRVDISGPGGVDHEPRG